MHENTSIINQPQSTPAALANEVATTQERQLDTETDLMDRFPIQLKLSVGAPNDPLEHEADAMADKVMRMPESSFIQRKSLHENNEYDDEHVQLKPLSYRPSFLQRCACNGQDDEHVQLKPLSYNHTSFIQRCACDSRHDEHVQLKPIGHASSFIQRKSSCSCGDYDDEHIHLKPLVNQITPFVQAKGDGGTTVSDSVSSQIRSTMGGGNSMQGGTKSFMENRFGTDFSDVKIHTGSESTQLSQSLNAKAFTVSNNIYFNSGQYQPDTSSGKHLLAHELTHVVQQGGTAGQDVQRKVSPKMGEIRDRLTYGIFDWAITDSDVHDVLVDLQALIPLDLRDTVAVMENEGLVTRLYDNLAESAERTKPFVPILMQQVQDARFLKGGGNGSCNAKQTAQSGSALGKIKEWANTTIDAVSDFEIGIDPVKSARIGKLLDKYFFHEAQAGVLSAAQRINFARLIISRIKTMRDKAVGTIINCASPFDLTCSGGNAIAYVSRGNPSVLRVCSIFFIDSAGSQIATTFHELMHFYNPQVDDTGYRHERIFEYLPPDRAVNNADSYSTFAMEIVLGEKAAAKELRSGRDSVQGCNPQQEANLRREIAFATRMIQNAVNQIDDNYPVQNSGNFASVNFHSTNHQDLIKFVERFHTVQNSIPNRIFFHCNVVSAQTTGALPFIDNSGLTLTQPYFNIASENNRVANLLAILFRKYSIGMTAAIWPSAPAYATQTLNQAYTNPAAYASYAQGVSSNSTAWNFADADVRYREEIQRTLERVRTEFNESFDDSEFKTHITDDIITYFANQLQAVHFTNHAQLDTGTTTLLQKITIIRALTDRMYHDYTRVNNDNFFTGLMTFDGSIFSESRLYRVFDFSYNRALIDLSASFGPILVRIDNGEAIKFADWADYPALLTKYQTESRNTISVMSTYRNYLKKLNATKESYNKSSEKLKNSPAFAGLPLIDSIFPRMELLASNTAFANEISRIENNIAIEVMHGRRFNPRNPDLPVSENLLRQFESRLSKIVHPSKLRVHKKLSVGAVNDPLEYEADAMADKIMKTPDDQTVQRKSSCSCNDYDDEHVHLKPLANQVTPFIQAKGDEGSAVSDSVSNRIRSTMGSGDTMQGGTKSFMENRFGADFSDVKIHTGDESIQLSQELNAKAFTVSNNIYFNSGQYQPDTSSGKHLLAHELTHVVQRGADANMVRCDFIDDYKKIAEEIALAKLDKLANKPVVTHGTFSGHAGCHPNFCQPFANKQEALGDLAWAGPLILAGIATKVNPRVVPLWASYISGGSATKDLTSSFGNDFTASPTTRKTTRFLKNELRKKVEEKRATIMGSALIVVQNFNSDLSAALHAIDDPVDKVNGMDFNNPKDIAGNIAGGIGKDQAANPIGAKPSTFDDSREAIVTAKLVANAGGDITVFPSIKFTVKDTIDLCPGDCGTLDEQKATVPLSRFEATGLAGDVPIVVVFDAPTAELSPFEIPLNPTSPIVAPTGGKTTDEKDTGRRGDKEEGAVKLDRNTAHSINVQWKNIDKIPGIKIYKGDSPIVSAKDFWNEKGTVLYDIVYQNKYYVKYDAKNGRLLFGNTQAAYILGFYLDDARNYPKNPYPDDNPYFGVLIKDPLNDIPAAIEKLKVYHGLTGENKPLKGKFSSGAKIIANSNKTTTILGSFRVKDGREVTIDLPQLFDNFGNLKNADFGAKKGGFNVLNVGEGFYEHGFFERYNRLWFLQAISRDDVFYAASDPTDEKFIYERDKNTNEWVYETDPVTSKRVRERTGFGKEVLIMEQNGYKYDPSTAMYKK